MSATVAPRAVTPPDAAAVASLLQTCAAEGAAVVASGGGTLQSIGNAPTRCDVVLHTTALCGVRAYDPRDMTVGVAAGTTIAALARALAAAGQRLPFDVPLAERATVGGTLAAGWIGPRRSAYGRPRDLLIGSILARADGTLAHAGGMVVKNVTGYDMSKLYVGSLGTLGIIVRANFKTLARPAACRMAVAAIGEEIRDRVVGALGSLTIEPSAALMIDGFHRTTPRASAPVRLVTLFEGSAAAVDRGTRELRSALGRAGVAETILIDADEAERLLAGIVDAYIETLDDRSLTYRATGLPSTAWIRSRSIAPLASAFGLGHETIADVRTGDVIARFTARDTAAFAAVVPDLDAAVRATLERSTVTAGAPALRARVDAWGPPPSTLAAMRSIKARFDPRGILAPGRFVGAI